MMGCDRGLVPMALLLEVMACFGHVVLAMLFCSSLMADNPQLQTIGQSLLRSADDVKAAGGTCLICMIRETPD